MTLRTRIRLFVLCLLLVASLAGSPSGRAQESIFGRKAPPPTPVAAPEEEKAPPPPPDPAQVLATLDLKGKIAQLMMVTLQGVYNPTEYDAKLLREYMPGAVILRQIPRPANAAAYVNELRANSLISGVPLLIGADLFSLVQRDRNAPSSFVQLPSLLSIAAAHDGETTARLGRLLGEYMAVMGLDFHVGPSLELAPQLENARGSIQDFGSDPAFAADAGSTLIHALRERGIRAIPWGFPGGGADRNAREAAVLLTPAPQLESTALLPYAAAIAEEVCAVHVANTLVPTIDSASPPASQSALVMHDLLRGHLHFEGIVVAGPMDSQVISDRGDVAEATLRALNAGADMIYWQGAVDAVMRTVDHLEKAVETGALSEARVDTSVRRILALKMPSDVPAEKKEALSVRDLDKLEKDRKLVEEAYQVERRSITLIQNRNQVLPLTKERSMPIALTGVVDLDLLQKDLEKGIAKPIAQQKISTALHMGDIEDFEITRLTSRLKGISTVVCVFTDSLRARGQVELVKQIKAKGLNVVAVCLGYPGQVAHLAPHADAIVLAYCNEANYQQTLRGVADVLEGRAPVRILGMDKTLEAKVGEVRAFDAYEVAVSPAGRLPVTLSDRLPAGYFVAYDPSLALKKIQWDFGDGGKSKDAQATHAYAAAGDYVVTLSVTDKQDMTTVQTFALRVSP